MPKSRLRFFFGGLYFRDGRFVKDKPFSRKLFCFEKWTEGISFRQYRCHPAKMECKRCEILGELLIERNGERRAFVSSAAC